MNKVRHDYPAFYAFSLDLDYWLTSVGGSVKLTGWNGDRITLRRRGLIGMNGFRQPDEIALLPKTWLLT